MSVRAVAVDDKTSDRLRVIPREIEPPRVIRRRPVGLNTGRAGLARRAAERFGTRRGPALWAQFTDDRQLIGLKLLMLGVLVVIVMLLEVPL